MTFILLPRRKGRPRTIERIAVTCWQCARAVEVDAWPMETVNDVVRTARAARMLAVEDDLNDRVLIFCHEGCAEKNRNAEGEYRNLAPEVKSRAGRILSSVYLL